MKIHNVRSVQPLLIIVLVMAAFLGPGSLSQALAVETVLYLHSDGGGCVTNATTFSLDTTSPPGTTAKCKDSPGVNRTTFKEIATWSAVPETQTRQVAALSDLHVWIGLKNSDDIGTYFDLRAELLKNGAVIAEGVTQNIQGVVRNASKAKEVTVAFGALSDNQLQSGDVLAVRILTKVTDQGGHSNAVGLRLYYDSTARTSRFGATFGSGVSDTTPPTITASASPSPNAAGWNNTDVTVTFTCSDAESGIASCQSPITVTAEGANQVITGTATDNAGNSTSTSVTLNIDKTPPTLIVTSPSPASTTYDATLAVVGTVSDANTIAQVRVNGTIVVSSGNAFTQEVTLIAGWNRFTVTATDVAGNVAKISDSVTLVTPLIETTPLAELQTAAPSLPVTTATNLASATEFLYTGASPLQTGVVQGTMMPHRAAVLRGRVLDNAGRPVSGVTLSVLGHPEYGQTASRANGVFDLAINGGGTLTLDYKKAGFLPAQRNISVPWQDYVILPDVVLIAYDARSTVIDLSSGCTDPELNCPPQPIRVAQGSLVSDADGDRQATLLFEPGTTAVMTFSDASPAFLPSVTVRATEYTVGPSGSEAMPAELPPTSGYTYAVEYSVDEALAAGASSVVFSPAVVSYVENFLEFPVGSVVPSGYYDRQEGAWTQSQSGKVIKILSITNGLAVLDVDGNGQPATAYALSTLGISDKERQTLATLYQSGQSLWRVPIDHFSPWDFNWGFGPPPDARPPLQPSPRDLSEEQEDPTCSQGSIIECQNQTLRERLPIIGTPYTINYGSSRVPGRTSAYTVTIPLSGADLPADLVSIVLEISLAGRQFTQVFPPVSNQTTTFTWDGRDAYGRTVIGQQPITVRVGYVYTGVYEETSQFGYNGNGQFITGSLTRQEVTLWRGWQDRIGPRDARGLGLGAWSLSIQHTYDPGGRVLYLGDGSQKAATSEIDRIITTVAGNGVFDFSGDGGPATEAAMTPLGVVVGSDGSLYIADHFSARVRKVDPNGIVTTVAGNGSLVFSGDGGSATQAGLYPAALALGPDLSLYIADPVNKRVRRVGLDGVITTLVADLRTSSPYGIAVGPDGGLYITDFGFNQVLRVAPTGNVGIVAGNGTSSFSGDGGPATDAGLSGPVGVAVGPDGGVYIADSSNFRIRRIGPDGIITTVAGNGQNYSSGDGGLATLAGLVNPIGVAVAGDGSVYIAESGSDMFGGYVSRIRRVGPEGIILTVAGNDTSGYNGDGRPATQAHLSRPQNVGVDQNGNLLIADFYNSRVRRLTFPLPGFSGTDIPVLSLDGREIYHFDGFGQHLETLDALTGVTRYRFAYDTVGLLATVTDGSGNMTAIQRDANGNPAAILAPHGQRTALTVDANGFLDSVTNPANETVLLGYTADGLLTSLTDPRGGVHSFSYDALGRLQQDTDPAGGFSVLSRVDGTNNYEVSLTTALGRTSTYLVEDLATGDLRLVDTDPSGLQTIEQIGTNGTRTTTAPDGTLTTLVQGPDPRFGMQAPLASSLTVATPGGLSSTTTTARTVTLADQDNPLSLLTQTDTISINGRTYTGAFDAAQSRITTTTPAGRQTVSHIDSQSRVTSEQVTGLDPLAYSYDAQGRLTTISQGTGSSTRTTTLAYNSEGYLNSITDPLSRSVSFAYDSAGRVLQQTLPDGRVIGYTYDGNGNVTSVTPPGRPSHGFSYTPVDLEEDYTPPDIGIGVTATQYAYNLDKQLTLVTRPDGQTIGLGYDTGGRLSAVTIPSGTVQYAYSPTTGNLSIVTAPDGGTLSYSYDGSLLTSTTWAGTVAGSVGRSYDNNFRMTSQTVNGANPISFGYDNDGLLNAAGNLSISRSAQNGLITGTTLSSVTDSRSYTSFGELDRYTANANGSPVLDVQYTRDSLGRITQKVETVGGVTGTYVYAYDTAGRLTDVTKNSVLIAHYSYDTNGNRLSVTTPSGTVSGTYDAQDRMLGYGTNTYTYTANGELLSKTDTATSEVTQYTYDVLGNLTAVTLPNGDQIEYVIDGQNRRVGKKVNGVLVQGFLYENQLKPVAELDGSGAVASRFVYGTKVNVPDYVMQGGVTYRIVSDHLGSPRLVVNVSTGVVVQQMDYDEFGNVILDTNPGFQPFGFGGGSYDNQTRLVRFGGRDYDPFIGRWTVQDVVRFRGGDTNSYEYVISDPINFLDPFGLWRNPSDIYNDAHNRAVKSGFPGMHNGLQDGYRHCLASCMMTRENSEWEAELLGWANEKRGDWLHNQERGERAADKFNNACGRFLGGSATSTRDCERSCRDAAVGGRLRTYQEGTTPGYLSQRSDQLTGYIPFYK